MWSSQLILCRLMAGRLLYNDICEQLVFISQFAFLKKKMDETDQELIVWKFVLMWFKWMELFVHLFDMSSSWKCVFYRGYSCFQAEPTTKVFVTWFAPVLVFIHFSFGYLLQPAHIKLIGQVVKAIHRKCWKDFSAVALEYRIGFWAFAWVMGRIKITC